MVGAAGASAQATASLALGATLLRHWTEEGSAPFWGACPCDARPSASGVMSGFLPISAVRSSFDQWNRDGTFVRINDALRKQARTAPGRNEALSVSVLHSQSVKTTEARSERGCNGKKMHERKRQFWVDTNGFLVRALVHAADISVTEGAAAVR